MYASCINNLPEYEYANALVTHIVRVTDKSTQSLSESTYLEYFKRMTLSDRRISELGGLRGILDQYKDLEWNWDGHSALPVSDETWLNAERFLTRLNPEMPLPTIYPNPNGTLSFRWRDDKKSAHLEMGKTRYSFYALDGDTMQAISDGGVSELEQIKEQAIEESIHALFGIDKTPSHQISELDCPFVLPT